MNNTQATALLRTPRTHSRFEETLRPTVDWLQAIMAIQDWNNLRGAWECPNATRIMLASIERAYGLRVDVTHQSDATAANTDCEAF